MMLVFFNYAVSEQKSHDVYIFLHHIASLCIYIYFVLHCESKSIMMYCLFLKGKQVSFSLNSIESCINWTKL